MQARYFTSIVILFFLLLTTSFGNWQKYVYDTSYVSFNSIAISSDNAVLAVGDYGKFARSTDKGSSWYYSKLETKNDLNFVCSINVNSFLVLDEQNYVYITEDKGLSWVLSDEKFSEKINNIKFNDKFGIAVSSSGSIYKSTNKGKSWDLLHKYLEGQLYDIDFSASNDIYISSNAILKSTNEGYNWEIINTGYTAYYKKIKVLDSIIYLIDNKLKYYVYNENSKTCDCYSIVKNYEKQYGNPQIINFTQFIRERAVVKVNDFAGPCTVQMNEYSTTDGGKSWIETDRIGDDGASDVVSMSILNSEFGISANSSGQIYKVRLISNITYTYNQLTSPFTLNLLGIDCATENQLAIVGLGGLSLYFLISFDGGQSWNQKRFNIDAIFKNDLPLSNLEDIAYTEDYTLFLLSNDMKMIEIDSVTTQIIGIGKLHKTTDMGETFLKYENTCEDGYMNIEMFDNNNGYIRETSNKIKFTTNAGESWDSIQIPEKAASIVEIFSLRPGNYFVETYNSTVIENRNKMFVTYDNGEFWYELTNDIFRNFINYVFMDENIGLAVGRYLILDYPKTYGDCIYKTEDAGQTWKECYVSELYNHFLGITFTDLYRGFAYTQKNILFTTDAGNTWSNMELDEMGENEKIVKILYPSLNKAICITNNNIFINNDIVTGIEVVNPASDEFSIFPNPSDGIINIFIYESSDSYSHIEIYDIFGKIRFRYHQYGNHSKYNLSFLENGLYFISIKFKDKIIVKPVTIIK
ncbi:MAG: T9SS type A sorting domain-containing protein [bacterium]